jgi:hypothetical protein
MIKTLALAGLLALSLPSAAQSSAGPAALSDRARLAETAQSIREFKTINGGYPSSLDELEPPTYRVHLDAAGRPPVYALTEDGISFAISYVGPDGMEGTEDDIRLGASGAGHRPARPPIARWLNHRTRK